MEINLGIYSMDIDFAETGEQALEFTKEKVYNLILLPNFMWGCRSCAQWLWWKCGDDPHTAREKVRVARALNSTAPPK